MGLSGGMDSTTLLGMLIDQGNEVHCCSFMYGSKHNEWELQSVLSIIDYYQKLGCTVFHKVIDLTKAFEGFDSALLKSSNEEIPEGHYNDSNMKATVVPGRNLIFASIMAGYAESIGAECIALGVHSGDHHIYPDCRPEFIYSLHRTLLYSTEESIGVLAPFLSSDKTKILKAGFNLIIPVPYHLTRTCYKNQEHSCGKCGSCRERLEAFENINKVDPITYE